jgi:hypothetical protein
LSDCSYKMSKNNSNSELSVGFYKKNTIKDSNVSIPKYEIPINLLTNKESLLDSNKIFITEKLNNFKYTKSSNYI